MRKEKKSEIVLQGERGTAQNVPDVSAVYNGEIRGSMIQDRTAQTSQTANFILSCEPKGKSRERGQVFSSVYHFQGKAS